MQKALRARTCTSRVETPSSLRPTKVSASADLNAAFFPVPPDEQPQLDVGSGGPDEYEVIPEHDGADGDVDHADEQAVREALGR